ncbi:MAG: alpha/beta hydrolase [Hyphomicrobiaceae bacterium]|nr:alpha/beta hydrolase [Hyphomicrobiaceae bacterium]
MLMYAPTTERVSPADAGLAGVDEIELTTGDGETVLAWWAKARPGEPTLLYFHGNGGSLANRADRLRKYAETGRGVFMMTYRGYGGSTGAPSERANVADAKRAYDWLVGAGVDPEDIVLYGESIGSGVAVQVAADRRVAGVVLDAPYTSILDVARLHYPYLPSRIFLRDRYDTMAHISRIGAPLLVVHGEADEVIPVEMGRAVHAAARPPKEIATFAGARHTDHGLFGSYEAIQSWLDRVVRKAAGAGDGSGEDRRAASAGAGR